MARLGVGLVGLGRWGAHVLRDLLALGAEVTVVSRGGRATGAAREQGAAGVVGSLAELPQTVRGLVVTTPTSSHAAVVESALETGLPLYVEKPLTDDLDAAARIAAAAPDRVFVMDKWRYHPGIQRLGELARSGELGRSVGLVSTRVGWGNPHGDTDGIWILVPHDLSIALEILGEIPEPRSAVAELTYGTASGIVALLGDDPWVAIEASVAHPIRRRSVRLDCEQGVAVLPEPFSDHLVVARGGIHVDVTLDEQPLPISTELPLLRELRASLASRRRAGDHDVVVVEGGGRVRPGGSRSASARGSTARVRHRCATPRGTPR